MKGGETKIEGSVDGCRREKWKVESGGDGWRR